MTTLPSNKKTNVWYKNYMVLIFVIGLPVLVVIVCLFFIFYSIKIQDATVRDDWYMDGKTLYQDASRDKLSYDLDISGVMRIEDHKVLFELNFPKDSLSSGQLRNQLPLQYPEELFLDVYHVVSEEKDLKITLKHQKDNRYQALFSGNLDPAKYYLEISDPKLKWRLVQQVRFPVKNIVFVPLSAFNESNNQLPDQKDKRGIPSQSQ